MSAERSASICKGTSDAPPRARRSSRHWLVVSLGAFVYGCGARSAPDLGTFTHAAGSTGARGSTAGAGGADAEPVSCDRDHDGFSSRTCGGLDCDDADPNVHPDAPDLNTVLGAWVIETLSAAGNLIGPALVVDRSRSVHLAFAADGAAHHFARRTPSAWRDEVLANARGVSELAVARESVHLAFGELGSGLQYAVRRAGIWHIELSLPNLAPDAVAVEADGSAHLLYREDMPANPANLKYMSNRSGTWIAEDLAPGVRESALAFGPDGSIQAALVVDAGARIWHALRQNGAWPQDPIWSAAAPVSPVPQSALRTTGFAIDARGVAHLAFTRDSTLFYAEHDAAGWRTEALGQQGFSAPSLAVDDAGMVYMLVPVPFTRQFFYFRGRAGHWSSELLAPGALPGDMIDATLRVDAAGATHIGFQELNGAPAGARTVGYATNGHLAPDGVDQNCDGVDGIDADHDSHASIETGGDDCDDQNRAAYPGAPELGSDDADSNCDGL